MGSVREVPAGWPAGVPVTGRHGFTPADRAGVDAAAPALAGRLAAALWGPGGVASGGVASGGEAPGRVLVLGTEELMYVPLRVAAALADRAPDGAAVLFSSTTRSPVLAVDDPGYAVRTRLAFPSHDDPSGEEASGDAASERYVYNVAAPAGEPGFDAVVLMTDAAGDTPALRAPGGLVETLREVTGEVVLCVLPEPARTSTARRALPDPLRGPAFGSYAPDEVGWLLTDLSGVALEAPVEEREEAVQTRGAHYAESLPLEYQPDAQYQALFHAALDASAARIARAVGTVTEAVLAARGPGAVLVSLARAGTPVGILMRRWALRGGVELPHYSVSIVRGRGIDPVALRWLAAHHDPADVVFLDGWTGKGAIARELAAALAAHPDGRFRPELTVLADPGGAVPCAGTGEDFLIPSACLNSTVSGLVSRTVLRADLIGPDDFHGAKFYADLAPSDVSAQFLDAVTDAFAAVAGSVPTGAAARAAAARPVTWAGWAAVERISAAYGIGDVNLVKPGVGETTRVLLRRVPWLVLVRPDREGEAAGPELDHIRLLAAQRGVAVETVPADGGLPFRCVGLIHPKYTRGAVGSAGTAVGGKA